MHRFRLPFSLLAPSNEASAPTTSNLSNRSLGRDAEKTAEEEGERVCLEPGPDTLSASVNLEDIIQDYDGASRRSKSISSSILSALNSKHLSQTYFSANQTPRDDETSFYSALDDGFSFDEGLLPTIEDSHFLERNSFWARDPRESDRMLARSDFQVNWYDVTYKIKPHISLSSLWYDLKSRFKASLGLSNDRLGFKGCGSSQSYVVNENNDKAEEKNSESREPITILQNVSGSFKSGQLTGVMGPSGAGKTSLLTFLSRRREEGFTGHLYLDKADHRINIKAIPQDDRMPEYLTVRENLMYASRLKNTYSKYNHEKTIEKVTLALGLDECLDTRTRNISGGQLKRLSIAQELLSRPDVLILDEPTSGLDSLTCFKILTVLKELVISSEKRFIDPIAVVLTIHQPQHEVFDLFDKVYVMAVGGVAIYDGPPSECLDYVERHTGLKMPTEDSNPASFLIEIASGEFGQEPIEALAKQVQLDFEASRAASNNLDQKVMRNLKSPAKSTNGISNNSESNSWTKGRSTPYIDHRLAKASNIDEGHFWLKTGVLSKRCWVSIIRDPKQFMARILFHIFLPISMAMLVGTEPGKANACPHYKSTIHLYDLAKDDSMTDGRIQDELLFTLENVGTLFIMTYSLVSANIAVTTLSFVLDIQSSLKEYHNGWYSMPSYLTARVLTNVPMDFILPMVAMAIGYVATGQYTGDNPDGMPDSYRVMLTGLAATLGSMIGQVFGMIVGALYIGHTTTALFVSQGVMLPFCLLSGMIVRARFMPRLFQHLSWISLFRHILEITFLLRWGFNVCSCDPNDIKPVQLLGVSEDLRSFVRYWMNSNSEKTTESYSPLPMVPRLVNSTQAGDPEKPDLFDTIVKQISYFNTYGMEVKSCEDVKPYQYIDFQLSESDLVTRYIIMTGIWFFMIMLLMVTVKLVIHFRTSL